MHILITSDEAALVRVPWSDWRGCNRGSGRWEELSSGGKVCKLPRAKAPEANSPGAWESSLGFRPICAPLKANAGRPAAVPKQSPEHFPTRRSAGRPLSACQAALPSAGLFPHKHPSIAALTLFLKAPETTHAYTSSDS